MEKSRFQEVATCGRTVVAITRPCAVERLAPACVDAHIRAHLEPEFPKGRDHLRLYDDAGATGGKLDWGALEDLDVPTVAQEADGGEQPADRAPDDQRAPLPSASSHSLFIDR
jgi:hypothetical protein